LALLINERGDITRRLVDAGDAVSEAFARTETQEGAVAKAARSQLTALGALLGAVGLPSPLLFLTASSELAVGATAEDVAGAEGVPTEYLSELTDQLERGGVIRRLEESIPPGSAMENEQTGRKARGTGASPPIRKPSVGLRHGAVPPIERFILASEAVKRNDSAAGRLLSAGDVVASHTAGRWSARASAHMLDAAFAIKADHRSLQAAHEQGLLPAIDTLLETARRINRGAPTPREQEVDLSQ
jgi:hypothetical protein